MLEYEGGRGDAVGDGNWGERGAGYMLISVKIAWLFREISIESLMLLLYVSNNDVVVEYIDNFANCEGGIRMNI